MRQQMGDQKHVVCPNGSWYVKTRALGIQPYFDSGFPYGIDQFISAAGTNWAVMALVRAASQPAAAGAVVAARPNAAQWSG